MMHKPHAWIEINEQALLHNLKQLKKVVPHKVLAPVIKGNAYGHGLLEVGRVCQSSPHVDWVCVASLSEALKLRAHGFLKPVLVLAYLDDTPELAIANDIDLLIYRAEDFEELSICAQKLNKPCNIHLKIDTGLSRFGTSPRNALTFIKQAQLYPGLVIRGIASHFSQAYGADLSVMHAQMEKFSWVLKKLERENIVIPYQHICNSAVTLRLNNAPGTFFRPGLSIHGFWPSEHVRKDAEQTHPGITLKPTMTWKTRIIEIKAVPAGQPVGYDGTFVPKKNTKLAIIAVGYADGYSKSFENTGMTALTHNQLAPVVGRIAMNTAMLDITDIKAEPHVGDEVILFGDYPGVRIDEIAQRYGKNPRELTTTIASEIQRILV